MVSAAELVVVSGSTLYLTCSIQPSSVDTPDTAMFTWITPHSTYSGSVNVTDDTSVELVISGVQTADSGNYACSATLADSSVYITSSEPATNSLNIIVSKYNYYNACFKRQHNNCLLVILSDRVKCDCDWKPRCSPWNRH